VNKKGVVHATGCKSRVEADGNKSVALAAEAIPTDAGSSGTAGTDSIRAKTTPAKKGKFLQALTNLWDEEMSMIMDDENMMTK